MKVILSRKGFDSSNGGHPSVILENKKMISLPIPSKHDLLTYSDIHLDDKTSYGDLLKQLFKKIKGYDDIDSTHCHLDPDLVKDTLERDSRWRGAFGQIGAAETVLENNDVGEGDLFLFFGWFNHVRTKNEKLKYLPGTGFHALYGYLQIDKIYRSDDNTPEWLNYHPHRHHERLKRKNNTIYLARERTTWNENIPGYGVFEFSPELILTKSEMSRSKWELPEFFRGLKISYHSEKSWKEDYFQSACIGQEFVIEENERVSGWARGIIERNKN